MDQHHIMRKLTVSCFLAAGVFLAAPVFALNVMTPVPVYVMPTSASAVLPAPSSTAYRTVTYHAQPDGTIGPVMHYRGYAVGSDGVVTPEIDHGFYRVTSIGQVEPTDNNGCHDGYCPMPGKPDQSQPTTESGRAGLTVANGSTYGLALHK